MTLHQQLIDFIKKSPTPYHAARQMSYLLDLAGFQSFSLKKPPKFIVGQSYYMLNQGHIIAFNYQPEQALEQGLRLVGAHTDSPCLRLKPSPLLKKNGFCRLGVEVYGGALLNPWFDRDLSLAGQVVYMKDGELYNTLLDFKRPIAMIPSLAIHLNRGVNKGKAINEQVHLNAVVSLEDDQLSFMSMLKKELDLTDDVEVLSHDLRFYDTQEPKIIGYHQDLLASARLDNLLSCFIGLRSLLDQSLDQMNILVCYDHEEVGSESYTGARAPLLDQVLALCFASVIEKSIVLANSLFISADNAHSVHPNYADCHDEANAIFLNKGVAIKVNANQRYATSPQTQALIKKTAKENHVDLQHFVMRSDMGCGSTIGPGISANLGVPTLDIGVPTLGMHSIRELAGVHDMSHLYLLLKAFYETKALDINEL